MDNILLEKIKKEIEGFEPEAALEEAGVVTRVGDGVAEVDGLADAVLSELVVFDEDADRSLEESITRHDAVYGLILNLEEESVRVVILGDTSRVREGMPVRRLGSVLSINVSDDMLGRVVNPLGEAIDGKGAIKEGKTYRIERQAPGVIDRAPVDTPIHTGLKAVDAMIPIGRGQRELIIGDRHTGKTTVAIDTILNQLNEPEKERPICIYVAIGQKESKTARIVAELEERGAMEYTIVVDAPASAPAALQFLAPYAGAAIGEFFMEQGRDALIIYDDLSKHAVAYRQISLLLRRPPGREAYPGDIFYLHSRLLERAAKLSAEKGGGSLTALPIIETQEGDVSAYIPTNVISITDGQIYLEGELFNKGVRPAINVGLSVSRVGSAAQTKAMKKVAGRIRLELAQFRELEAFMQFAQDLDEHTKRRIENGLRLSEALKQGRHAPMPFEDQVIVIFAAVEGFLGSVAVEKITEATAKLLDFMKREHAGLVAHIRDSKQLADDTDKSLRSAIESFAETHQALFSASGGEQK